MIISSVVFLMGLLLVAWTLSSVVRAFVLPRSDNTFLTWAIFRGVFTLFHLRLRNVNSYADRDRIMAFFAPVALLVNPLIWLALVLTGYVAMFWAVGVRPLKEAFILSGSSLYTLGFATTPDPLQLILIFSEATIGLGLVALLISYLPTMYSAFSQRERAVAMLEVRAGSPPTAVEMLSRFQRLNSLQLLDPLFAEWEIWFANLEESHTSLAALVFFRSPQPDRSWITAAGAVLDSAALYLSITGAGDSRQAALCIRAGYIALRRIADFFNIPYDPDPAPTDPISIARSEFDVAYTALKAAGLPMTVEPDQAWRDFAGWRVNYDTVLISLAAFTMAPYAPWSSDRSLASMNLLRQRAQLSGGWRARAAKKSPS